VLLLFRQVERPLRLAAASAPAVDAGADGAAAQVMLRPELVSMLLPRCSLSDRRLSPRPAPVLIILLP